MRGHGQLAGGEHPAAAFFWRGAQRAQGVAIVCRGVGLREAVLVGVPDGGHAEGAEDALGEEVEERLAGDDLDDAAGDDVVGVGVLPLGAGLEVERLFGPDVEDVLSDGGLDERRHHVVLGPVILIAGGVGENLADGHFIAVREAGNIFSDGIVEREFSLLLEQQNGCRSELL